MGVVTSSRIKGLEESFQTFNELSQSLETTYHSLEDRVNELQSHVLQSQREARSHIETQDRARLLSTVLKVLPAGVLVLDSTGRVQECNQAAEALLGQPLHGELWIDVVKRCFAPQDDDGYEVSLRDGRRVSVSTCPLGDEPGQVLLLTDVTETRSLQDRLSQQKRLAALGEMAASLAHQIRTPLSAAILSVSQIKNNRLPESKRNDVVDKLLVNIRQLENLVNDMLLFSRSGYTGEEPFSIESLLDSLERAIQNNVQAHAQCDAHTCQIINETHDISVVGNPHVLQSALLNLVNNAIEAATKANGTNGQVKVLVYSLGLNTVDIKVLDNGYGVPQEIQEKIFDPFFTTRSNGTGLGLAVVRAIARAHRGEVWLESSADSTVISTEVSEQDSTQVSTQVSKYGEGSAFIMRLPTITTTNP
jgi:two-component system sensor histidine kinase FlrB